MAPSEVDLHLFAEGTHTQLHRVLGARVVTPNTSDPKTSEDLQSAVEFVVWAPNARSVNVIGDWNGWTVASECQLLGDTGVWSVLVTDAHPGHRYKYRLQHDDGSWHNKADPMATASEPPPGNASIVSTTEFVWTDSDWLSTRDPARSSDRPLSIYELHLGSWKRDPSDPDRVLSYREIAPMLAAHCHAMHFTHVEFLPLMEHPFTGSWGYQVTGFFAPTARHGTPDDLRWCINHLHREGIGVILDWVPAHFPDDAHALGRFDGTALYEHADPRQGRHPDWGTLIFNYGRNEVRSFLRSNARYWIEEFHADGLRVDAVASMLYRDYSRAAGEWIPNRLGGRENLEATSLLTACSSDLRDHHPGVLFIAEESTSWPGVTAPVGEGGLGFTHKWDLGWMNDTLTYLRRDPVHRRWHQRELTFRVMYAQSERFVLPLSHDEVVHGKGSLINKMPGDEWQQAANLRLLHGLHHTTPGKKLLFMGGEFGQRREWDHDESLDWHLLSMPLHRGIMDWVAHLNDLHQRIASLHHDAGPNAFEWIDCTDEQQSVLSWTRRSGPTRGETHAQARGYQPDETMVIMNCTPVPHSHYDIGARPGTAWGLLANSDDQMYGGSGYAVHPTVAATSQARHGHEASVACSLPPLSILIYRILP